MQQLTANITIPVPENLILISKAKLESLKKESLVGTYWTMKDVEEKVNRKHEWIKENILYPSHFRKILDVDNGGFVFYPKVKGQTWSFQATKMAKFLDEQFTNVFSTNQ